MQLVGDWPLPWPAIVAVMSVAAITGWGFWLGARSRLAALRLRVRVTAADVEDLCAERDELQASLTRATIELAAARRRDSEPRQPAERARAAERHAPELIVMTAPEHEQAEQFARTRSMLEDMEAKLAHRRGEAVSLALDIYTRRAELEAMSAAHAATRLTLVQLEETIAERERHLAGLAAEGCLMQAKCITPLALPEPTFREPVSPAPTPTPDSTGAISFGRDIGNSFVTRPVWPSWIVDSEHKLN